MYRIGVDLGGTNIKAGIVDCTNRLLRKASVPTRLSRKAEVVCDDMIALVCALLEQEHLGWEYVQMIGIACPGTVHSVDGRVVYANNLQWEQFPLRDYVRRQLEHNIPVYLGNDANAAAIGEYVAGSAKGTDSAIVITIGTGLGTGVIVDGKLLEGHSLGASEFGHMVIEYEGRPCTCGRKGCLEAYASATGLITLTKEELERSPDSALHTMVQQEGKVSGRTAFSAMKQGDQAAGRVVARFIGYLACGVANMINAIQPEVVCIGGGVSGEGDNLLVPLREKVWPQIYGNQQLPHPNICLCALGNDAGIVGAASLGIVHR